jgi:D-amino-acid oxidase
LQFKSIPSDQLAPGIDNAQEFTSVCINTAVYLPWLVGQCVKTGAVFKRASFKHIAEAAHAHHSGQKADVVINCTGLSSKFLGGVLDQKMYPARGQIVVVRNDPGPMVSVSGTDDGEDEVLYIMTRAAGTMKCLLWQRGYQLIDFRRRNYPRWLLSEGQLGPTAGYESCKPDHETLY